MPERIIIVGAGIAGLATALALSRAGYSVVILERDAAPLVGTPDDVFTHWKRPGVPQLRHSHGFLARLRNLLRHHYADLYQALLVAGVRELRFVESLPRTLLASYMPQPADEDLTALLCRRTTFESVLRRYVLAQPGVSCHTGVQVTGLLTATASTGVHLTGVMTRQEDRGVDLPAAVIIDASGRRSPFPAWLRQHGARIPEQTAPTGILYYSQCYRLRDGSTEPERSEYSSLGDLGYLKFGVWPADNQTFSVTLAIPTIETEFRALHRPEVFAQVCCALPALARWTAPDRAIPIGSVRAMGDLHSNYRCFVTHKQPAALGYFAVGEAAMYTNPLYGRGCTLSFLHAHLLVDVLRTFDAPDERAWQFHRLTHRHLYPFYRAAARQDRAGLERARRLRESHAPPSRRERLARSFVVHGIIPATRGDLEVRRAVLRDFHMLEPPGQALRRLRIVFRLLRFWLRGQRRNAALSPPPAGPGRMVMRQQLGLTEPDAHDMSCLLTP
jgi:2-polyprenyl-6-methoxyphenol hydroxylase-like FAD-dependent oxidoreductase